MYPADPSVPRTEPRPERTRGLIAITRGGCHNTEHEPTNTWKARSDAILRPPRCSSFSLLYNLYVRTRNCFVYSYDSFFQLLTKYILLVSLAVPSPVRPGPGRRCRGAERTGTGQPEKEGERVCNQYSCATCNVHR